MLIASFRFPARRNILSEQPGKQPEPSYASQLLDHFHPPENSDEPRMMKEGYGSDDETMLPEDETEMGSEPLFTEKPECNPTKAELKQDLGDIRNMMVVIMEKNQRT